MTVAKYYGAKWCGPCHTMRPVVVKVCAELGIELQVLDIDEDGQPPEVTNVPTLVYGDVTVRGLVPESRLRAMLEDA